MILAPLNDYKWSVPLTEADGVTPITTGSVAAFLAASKTATAAADATLNCTVAYSAPLLAWEISIDASQLVKALLDTLFATSGRIYLIVMRTDAIWRYVELSYEGTAGEMVAA